ncbi:MAG: PEP/pyruvate-binding domain-containing protein, partial [Candidatus Nanoarchaeia archaeon]
MAYCKWFKQLSKNSIPEAGGKGANLAEMWNAGFPVPPGFVVLASAYRDFMRIRKLDVKIEENLKDLDIEDT